MPQHWEETRSWVERLGLEYRGEGLPGPALKALQALVRRNRERVYLDGPQKAELLELFDLNRQLLLLLLLLLVVVVGSIARVVHL